MERLWKLLAFCVAAVLLAHVGNAAVNTPPTANPDYYLVNEDFMLYVAAPGPLVNDTDLDGDLLTATLLTLPANGTLNFTNNGAFSYRPQTNFFGTDSFTYRTRDGTSNSLPTTVTITVSPINDAPRATNNTYSADADSTLFVDAPGVLGNDADVDGDSLYVVLVSSPIHGFLYMESDGSFIYTPDEGYTGTDTFTYRASDGQVLSAVATVTINVVPAPIMVTTPLANQSVCVGDNVTLSVAAIGTALTYQWFKGTTQLTSKTNNNLTLSAVTTADAATYKVRLTGATNSVTNSAILTVNVPIAATPLTNQFRALGLGITFSTTASGTGPLTYTWMKNDVIIPGKTSNALMLTNLVESDSAVYSVVVNGACGSVTRSATLTVAACYPSVDVMLVIDRSGSMSGQAYTDARSACTNFVRNMHLVSTNGDILGLASFNPTATLNQSLTNNTLAMEKAISALGAATNGTCISCGLQIAQNELTSVRHRPEALPVIILLSDGLPHDFDTPIEALGVASQAKNTGTRILTIGLGSGVDPVLMANMASSTNDYFFANNSSELGSVFDAISAAICRPPTNIFGPSALTACAGATVSFEVQASGCEAFAYQWRKSSQTLIGETNNVLTLGNVTPSDAAIYSVVVSSTCRVVTNSATLAVSQPAELVTPLNNRVSHLGDNVIFSAGVSGTTLSYYWFFNGTLIGTESTLTIPNLTAEQVGNYCVVAVNALCGEPVTNCATLTLNRAPVANDDVFSGYEDFTLVIPGPGVLSNDTDADGNPLVVIPMSEPAHGTLILNDDGSFVYVPSPNFYGADSFSYRVSDGDLLSAVATVNLTVASVNDRPVATADSYTLNEDSVFGLNAPGVLGNDADIDGDILSAVLVSEPSHGSILLNGNGSFQYTPDENFNGSDSFAYSASDGSLSSVPTVVNLTVLPVNDAPVANADSYTINEDTILTVGTPGVLSNDTDLDGSALTVILLTASSHGTLNLAANGSFTYTPATNFFGVDTFVYQANDGQLSSAPTTVTITVNPVNDAPIANNDAYTASEDATLNVPASIGVLLNDSDVDGGALTASLMTTTINGVLTFNANGSFAYVPATNFNGVDHFTYRVSDGSSNSALATVTITVTSVNDVPVAQNDSYVTLEDVSLVIGANGVLTNDSDADGDALTALIATNPAHGTVQLSSNGSFIYTPVTNFSGMDSFTYRARDGSASSAPAVVSIRIDPVNDTPVAMNDGYATTEDVVLNVSAANGVMTNDFDADGDSLIALLESTTTNGTLTLRIDGGFTYVPRADFFGVDRFTYRVIDNISVSETAAVIITVSGLNDAPVANNDSYATDEDTVLTVSGAGVLANDIDVDGDAMSAALVSGPIHGTLTLNANGGFIYTPTAEYDGTDSFSYRARDGATNSNVATVTILVRPVNDSPVSNSDGAGGNFSVLEDQVLTVAAPGVLANDNDADGDILTAVLVSGAGHGIVILNSSGSFVYTPVANYFGNDSFTYVANDGRTNSSVATVSLVVLPVNDAPTFVVGPNQRVKFDAELQSVANWATGISRGPANESAQTGYFISWNDNPSLFSAQPTINANGRLTYTPAGTGVGVANVSVEFKDSGGTANGGTDTSASQAFVITLDGPPIVNIVNPTNGSVFVGTNDLGVVAEASDSSSTVTNVQIFLGTNLIGSFPQAPYFALAPNVPPGTYSFFATAVNDLGLRATSSVVTVTVTPSPPVSALGPIVLNNQNGLFEQFARIVNPSPKTFPNGVRLFISGLDSTNRVYNATGTNAAGVPYIDVPQTLAAGGSVDVLVQYFVPNVRSVPNPTLSAEPLPYAIGAAPTLMVISCTNGNVKLRFNSAVNRQYYLQSTEDFLHWQTLPGLMQGTGDSLQCSDSPGVSRRFYRVLMLP